MLVELNRDELEIVVTGLLATINLATEYGFASPETELLLDKLELLLAE